MTKAETIKRIVDRFLRWKLPEDFRPDCGIEFDRDKYVRLNPINRPFEPVGTNLLSATQATAMVEAIAGEEIDALQAALTAERARVVELEAENAKLREPDWFWETDNPETGASSEDELADMVGETAVVMELGCAVTLPSFWMAATYHDRSGWSATRHETRDDAIRAVDARAALTAHTETREGKE